MSSVEALARVLMQTEYPDRNDAFYVHFLPEWRAYAERILADPGPLLAALAEAGVIHPQLCSRSGMACFNGWTADD